MIVQARDASIVKNQTAGEQQNRLGQIQLGLAAAQRTGKPIALAVGFALDLET